MGRGLGAWRRVRSGQSGASAVEFALVFPVILLLTFGVMEFSFLMRDDLAITNLARDASRSASTNPRVGNVEGHWGLPGTPKPGGGGNVAADAIPSFAYIATQAIETRGSALNKDSIIDFWVYLANNSGYPTLSGNWKTDANRSFGSPAEFATYCPPATCVRFTWLDASNEFRFDGRSTWDPASVNACPRTVPATLAPTTIPDGQAVGVFIRVDHRSIFPGFFNGKTLKERNMVKFEPMRPVKGICSPA